jgi:anthranilate phosphoribosyltransferase
MRCHVDSNEPVLDIVGTGGDASSIDTFNVSTAAAIVCAAAGVKISFSDALQYQI